VRPALPQVSPERRRQQRGDARRARPASAERLRKKQVDADGTAALCSICLDEQCVGQKVRARVNLACSVVHARLAITRTRLLFYI
jgi:hypothetical protein